MCMSSQPLWMSRRAAVHLLCLPKTRHAANCIPKALAERVFDAAACNLHIHKTRWHQASHTQALLHCSQNYIKSNATLRTRLIIVRIRA